MNLHVVSIDYTLTRPDPSLGDEHMCELFHRVSARCPVLHLYGHIHTECKRVAEPSASCSDFSLRVDPVAPMQQRTACVHVHGVYPYFMVPQYDTRVSATQFAAQLESVAVAAFGLRPTSGGGGGSSQVLHNVKVVRMLPFYGFHATARPFFRVSVVDPAMVGELVKLLCTTTRVGGRRWQSYESHAPFHTQFMTNYGVKGMAPFRIPSCTARLPLPPELCDEEMQKRLFMKRIWPLGEPPRLTRAEVELDVDASTLHALDVPMEPGENLLSVRRMVRKYFFDYGVDDNKRKEATIDAIERRYSVADLQERDPVVMAMRSTEIKNVQNRLAVVSERKTLAPLSADSYVASSPRVASDSPNKDGLTQQLMDELHKSSVCRFSFDIQSSTESEDDMEEVNNEKEYQMSITKDVSGNEREDQMNITKDMSGDVDECTVNKNSPMNKETDLAASQEKVVQTVHSSDTKVEVGEDTILFSDASQEKGTSVVNFTVGDSIAFVSGPRLTAAKIIAMRPDAGTVLLSWYIALRETHIADSQEELERCGRWLRGDREVLLGNVEDENPLSVLEYARRAIILHTYSQYLRSISLGDASSCVVLLCRYTYNAAESRFGLAMGVGERFISFPAVLDTQSAALDESVAKAGFVDDSKALLSSSQSSADNDRWQDGPPLRDLRRSVSAVRRGVAASQVSLYINASPSPFPEVRAISEGETMANARSHNIRTESAADVEWVDALLLRECQRDGFAIRSSAVAGDLQRNYRCFYDAIRHRVVVSASSWPLSLSSAPRGSCDADGGSAQASVPLLSFVAPSQIESRPSKGIPQGHRQPRTQSSASHSIQRGARATCSLRLTYVEVLVGRRRGVQNIASDELLAVALGRTESTHPTIAVRLFCVAPPGVPHGRQCFSGAAEIVYVASETHLLRIVRRELRAHDPDVILSWEGLKYGIGLLAMRYASVMRRSLARDLSRLTLAWQGTEKEDESAEDEDAKQLSVCCCSSSSSSSSSPTSMPDDEGHAQNDVVEGKDSETVRRLSRRFGAGLRVAGRTVVSLGRQLSKVLPLPSYTLQMVHQHLFGEIMPQFDDVDLAEMYRNDETRRVALSVLLTSVAAPHRVAQHLNFYTRTIEYARMFGILFHEVLSRGSQFRVESTLHRMARPLGYVMLSPLLAQVHRQPRLQSMPLVMQPRSGLYREDPVVVLDFRSLYPSVVIAYNLCYSTCLGIVGAQRRGRLGVVPSYKKCDRLLHALLSNNEEKHRVTFAPNGCMFLPPDIRVGVLPQMLRALLDTRFELQAALRYVAQPHEDRFMQRVLNEQQAAIKLLSNTTYGYTAASFSGRMPCRDVADAIVLLGRKTLERAIELINSHSAWRAEVVYGDTDSLFVRLPGRTRAEAFAIGDEMARAVTAANPTPVQLQFEKVLQPCLLLVKKRYVGYAYFRPDQQEPQFLAKGIETVRRDQCPATSRFSASVIKRLFAGATPEELRAHFYEEVGKFQRGVVSPIDCIFRRAVKLGRYCSDASLPLGARLALKLIEKDITQTPYWGERIPYVVVHSMESTRLSDKVVHPRRLLHVGENVRIHSEYYIKHHIIPTLDRMLYLVGLSAARWYAEMPRRRTYCNYFDGSLSVLLPAFASGADVTPSAGCGLKRQREEIPVVVSVNVDSEEDTSREKQRGMKKSSSSSVFCPTRRETLDAYYQRALCAVCHEECTGRLPPTPPLCDSCLRDPSASLASVVMRRHYVEKRLRHVETACFRCIGSCGEGGGPRYASGVDIEDLHFSIPRHTVERCISIDCLLSFEKRRLVVLYAQLIALEQFIMKIQV